MNMNAGTKIVRSCELVDKLWMQIQDLGNSLSAMTESALEMGEFGDLRSARSSSWSAERSASGWGSTAYAISFPVMKKKRGKAAPTAPTAPTAWINYQISVFGAGIPPATSGDEESIGPVVHVSFWDSPTDFDDPHVHVKFPPAWDEWEINDERLLFWESEKDRQFPQWTFSTSLLDLGSEDALRAGIIEPIRALLAGATAAVALPASLPGLVFYADKDEGESGWTLAATTRK